MNDDFPIFVASPIEVYHDEKAREMLAQVNDNRFHTDADGIVKVDLQRWEQAQSYERKTWMEYNLDATEDRNTAHAQLFDHYAALPENLGDVLEIGCGPFTNTYTMLQNGHEVNTVTLVDPLLNQYLAHPHKKLNTFMVPKTLISLAFEDADVGTAQYDTILLINVLPHCRDARLVFEKIQTALRPGGYLVFAEFPAQAKPTELYDVGHPIAPTAAFLADFLQGFEEVYRHGWYFIGRKGGVTGTPYIGSDDPTVIITWKPKPIPETSTITGNAEELPPARIPDFTPEQIKTIAKNIPPIVEDKPTPKPRAKRTKKAK